MTVSSYEGMYRILCKFFLMMGGFYLIIKEQERAIKAIAELQAVKKNS